MHVVCDSTDEVLGQVDGILIHPDTGRVEGFSIGNAPATVPGTPFLASDDILCWGNHLHVRDHDAVYPLEERVRLQRLLDDPRRVLGQRVRTEGGRNLGNCRDVQFNTGSMRCEWIFPRRFWRWGVPVALADIVEILPSAIIVRDPPVPVPAQAAAPSPASSPISPIPEIGGVPSEGG